MLRVTEFLRHALEGTRQRPMEGVVLIWNLTNRCNLSCKHCYSSANLDTKGELTREEILSLIPSLKRIGVRFAVLSGGEPLIRDDLLDIAALLRSKGIRTYLSTNGILITKENVRDIASCFDYVGVSVDGTPKVHDAFRGKVSSFEEAVRAIEICMSEGIKTGIRFTLTSLTLDSLPFVFKLARIMGVPRFYISHLVYAGRGLRISGVHRRDYRAAVEFVIRTAIDWVERGIDTEIVTGNNEADAAVLYKEFSERYPDRASDLLTILKAWGGNQAGVRLMNIDFRGNVRPDPFFPITLGNIRERPLEDIWMSNGILSWLRERPRRVSGRCSACPYLDMCNGNSRARALVTYGSIDAEDPACYL